MKFYTNFCRGKIVKKKSIVVFSGIQYSGLFHCPQLSFGTQKNKKIGLTNSNHLLLISTKSRSILKLWSEKEILLLHWVLHLTKQLDQKLIAFENDDSGIALKILFC
jgi:hypothetical protein